MMLRCCLMFTYCLLFVIIIKVCADEAKDECTNSLAFQMTEFTKIILAQHDIIEQLNASLREQKEINNQLNVSLNDHKTLIQILETSFILIVS